MPRAKHALGAPYRFDPKLLLTRHEDDWVEVIEPYATRVLEVLGARTGTLLDVGGGRGGLDVCMALISDLDFMCTDLNPKSVAYAADSAEECGISKRMSCCQADAQDLPFDDDSFEFAMSTQSICGWDNPQKGIEEMYRVLKPGGRIYIRGFGDNYRNFYKILRDTGIEHFEIVQDPDMSYISIWKDEDAPKS